MSARTTFAPALVALLALGCEPSSVQDLSRPALIVVVHEASGFCSATIAVDSSGDVWEEEGCESRSTGLARSMRRVADADRAAFESAMQQVLELPEDGDCAVINPSARRYRFTRTAADGTEASVLQCEPGVPESARGLVRQFEALRDPVDAGPNDAGPVDAG